MGYLLFSKSMYLLLSFIFCSLTYLFTKSHSITPTLTIAFICRNEGVNFNSNLELWVPLASRFVFLIDSRNNDKSIDIISNILSKYKHIQYKILSYEFIGFAQARSQSLAYAWEYYGNETTHVLIGDPDWRPISSSFQLSELATFDEENINVYRFKLFDRNGITFRQMDWLLRHKQGLKMKYHLHEVLDIGYYNYSSVKEISLLIQEVEQPGTWHNLVGHEDSFSVKRYLFDISLLLKDYELYRDSDAHTHYYLGVTHHAVADKLHAFVTKNGPTMNSAYESMISQLLLEYAHIYPTHDGTDSFSPIPHMVNTSVSMYQYHINECTKYLNLRLSSTYEDEFTEERWAAQYLLGSVYAMFLNDFHLSKYWFQLCQQFNPFRVECTMNLVRIYANYGMLDAAKEELQKALKVEYQVAAITFFKEWECHLPALVIQVYNLIFEAYSRINAQYETLSNGELKYLALLLAMANRRECHNTPQTSTTTSVSSAIAFTNALQSQFNQRVDIDQQTFKLFKNVAECSDLCKDVELLIYLIQMGYTAHVCESETRQFRQQSAVSASSASSLKSTSNDDAAAAFVCTDFTTDLLPPIEDYQVLLQYYPSRSSSSIISSTAYSQNYIDFSFIGAANILDIIHYAHHGYAPPSLKIHYSPLLAYSSDSPYREQQQQPHQTNSTYRILFAEYFNPRNVYFLYSFLKKHTLSLSSSTTTHRVEVVIVTPDILLIHKIQNKINICIHRTIGSSNNIKNEIVIKYENDDLSNYLKSLISKPADQVQFDYIEYNGGLSFSNEHIYKTQLNLMSKYLSTNGVIGITYFTCNIHQQNIQNLIKSSHSNDTSSTAASGNRKKVSPNTPYIDKSWELLKLYWVSYFNYSLTTDGTGTNAGNTNPNDIRGMDRFLYDRQLTKFLSFDTIITGRRNRRTIKANDFQQFSCFKESFLLPFLESYHLTIQAVLPSAYAHPYMLKEPAITKLESLGINEEIFTYNYFPSFHNTLYLTKSESVNLSNSNSNNSGSKTMSKDNDKRMKFSEKASLSHSIFDIDKTWSLHEGFTVIDRTGFLEHTFGESANEESRRSFRHLAATMQSTTITIKHYSNTYYNIDFVVLPEILPCLSMFTTWSTAAAAGVNQNKFSAQPKSVRHATIYELHEYNKHFHTENIRLNNEAGGSGGGGGRVFDARVAKRELIAMLKFLDEVHIISLIHMSSYALLDYHYDTSSQGVEKEGFLQSPSITVEAVTTPHTLTSTTHQSPTATSVTSHSRQSVVTEKAIKLRNMGFSDKVIRTKLKLSDDADINAIITAATTTTATNAVSDSGTVDHISDTAEAASAHSSHASSDSSTLKLTESSLCAASAATASSSSVSEPHIVCSSANALSASASASVSAASALAHTAIATAIRVSEEAMRRKLANTQSKELADKDTIINKDGAVTTQINSLKINTVNNDVTMTSSINTIAHTATSTETMATTAIVPTLTPSATCSVTTSSSTTAATVTATATASMSQEIKDKIRKLQSLGFRDNAIRTKLRLDDDYDFSEVAAATVTTTASAAAAAATSTSLDVSNVNALSSEQQSIIHEEASRVQSSERVVITGSDRGAFKTLVVESNSETETASPREVDTSDAERKRSEKLMKLLNIAAQMKKSLETSSDVATATTITGKVPSSPLLTTAAMSTEATAEEAVHHSHTRTDTASSSSGSSSSYKRNKYKKYSSTSNNKVSLQIN